MAEVASTLNDNLLLHYMLDQPKDKDTRLFLLGSYLDGLRLTLFRQTLFAEFEMKIHELAEQICRLANSRSTIVLKPLPSDDPKQRRPDIRQAREHLGWEPKVSLEAGLKKTIAYFDAILSKAAVK